VINRLNRAANAAANDKDILERFAALGFETAPGTPQALAERTKVETAKWAKAIREARIEPE
jgi:tripartite-type tricarboxylate transporter receptor subunit TctC